MHSITVDEFKSKLFVSFSCKVEMNKEHYIFWGLWVEGRGGGVVDMPCFHVLKKTRQI